MANLSEMRHAPMLAGGVIRTASSRKASGWTSTALSESSDQYQFLEVLPSPRELAHSPSIPGDVLIVHADRGVRRTVSGEIPYRHWKEAPSGQAIADSYLGKIEGNVKEEVRGRGHFIRTKVPFERPPPTLSFFASSGLRVGSTPDRLRRGVVQTKQVKGWRRVLVVQRSISQEESDSSTGVWQESTAGPGAACRWGTLPSRLRLPGPAEDLPPAPAASPFSRLTGSDAAGVRASDPGPLAWDGARVDGGRGASEWLADEDEPGLEEMLPVPVHGGHDAPHRAAEGEGEEEGEGEGAGQGEGQGGGTSELFMFDDGEVAEVGRTQRAAGSLMGSPAVKRGRRASDFVYAGRVPTVVEPGSIAAPALSDPRAPGYAALVGDREGRTSATTRRKVAGPPLLRLPLANPGIILSSPRLPTGAMTARPDLGGPARNAAGGDQRGFRWPVQHRWGSQQNRQPPNVVSGRTRFYGEQHQNRLSQALLRPKQALQPLQPRLPQTP